VRRFSSLPPPTSLSLNLAKSDPVSLSHPTLTIPTDRWYGYLDVFQKLNEFDPSRHDINFATRRNNIIGSVSTVCTYVRTSRPTCTSERIFSVQVQNSTYRYEPPVPHAPVGALRCVHLSLSLSRHTKHLLIRTDGALLFLSNILYLYCTVVHSTDCTLNVGPLRINNSLFLRRFLANYQRKPAFDDFAIDSRKPHNCQMDSFLFCNATFCQVPFLVKGEYRFGTTTTT
jgi:hypothetical protein